MSQSKIQNPKSKIVIVCPLRFEQKALHRLLAGLDCIVDCSGPGEGGVQRWMAARGGAIPARSVVILAGVAGSLVPDLRVGEAQIIDIVRSEDGHDWKPSLTSPLIKPPIRPPLSAAGDTASIVSVHALVREEPARRALAQRSGAAMVDMESLAFARNAALRGWRWGIVRGVSDDLSSPPLPPGMEQWISADGRTRLFAVLASLAQRPRLLRTLQRLRADSLRALESAATLLRLIIAAHDQKNV